MYVCEDLKLIVTTKPGKEKVVENQVGDSIYLNDPGIKIIHTRFSGVLLIYTKLNPWKAFWLVNTYPIHGASRIIPVECCSHSRISEVIECVKRLLSKGREYEGKIGVEITIRGNFINKNELKNSIYRVIRELGLKIVFKNVKYELKVEVIDNIVGVSVMPWRMDRVSRRIKEWIKRLGISNSTPF